MLAAAFSSLFWAMRRSSMPFWLMQRLHLDAFLLLLLALEMVHCT